MPLDSKQFGRNFATACYHRVAKTVIIKGRYDWLRLPNAQAPRQVLLIESLRCFGVTATQEIAIALQNDKPVWTNRHVGLDKALRGSTYTFDFDDENLHDIPALEDAYQSLKLRNEFVLGRGVEFDKNDAEQYKCLQLLLFALSHVIFAPNGGGGAIASNDLETL